MSPSSGCRPGSQRCGSVYVTLFPRLAEAEHPSMRRGARELPPPRPLVLEGVHRPLAGPRTGTLDDRIRQLVDRQLRVRERVADRRDDLLGLLGGEADRLGMHRYRRRQCRKGARPHRQVCGRQQVHGAARTERLAERPVVPDRPPHVGTGRPEDTPPDRELGGAEDLRVCATHHARDAGRVEILRGFSQRVAVHPPCRDAVPAQRHGRHGRLRHRSSSCQFGRMTRGREKAAGDPVGSTTQGEAACCSDQSRATVRKPHMIRPRRVWATRAQPRANDPATPPAATRRALTSSGMSNERRDRAATISGSPGT